MHLWNILIFTLSIGEWSPRTKNGTLAQPPRNIQNVTSHGPPWLENAWFFLDFDDFQMVLKRENIWSSKTNHQGVRKKSSAMFSPIRNTKNLDIKSETCLFWRGLERGWCSPRWSQVIPRNFWETAPEKWKPISKICGNMLKQLEIVFFLRCTLDMTQHRTDWWNASNFHTSPFHRQSINFLEPMLPVMLQAFFAMFSYRNMLHVAVCCPFPGSRSRRKDQWINQQQCSSIARGNDFLLYVARKQPKKHNGEILTVDFSEPSNQRPHKRQCNLPGKSLVWWENKGTSGIHWGFAPYWITRE